jgi:isopentenyl phosphate kinase
MQSIIFLKLGGSLITNKSRAYTPRIDLLEELIDQISRAKQKNINFKLLLGHGSGSFGHMAAKEYFDSKKTQNIHFSNSFTEIWYQASELNRLIIDILRRHELPSISISPISSIRVNKQKIISWEVFPIESALEKGIIPVVYGDVVFNVAQGVTILSTEDLFAYLAYIFQPKRILLAGQEEGIWNDFPERKHLVKEITPKSFTHLKSFLRDSIDTDVTGGMISKVKKMVKVVVKNPGITVSIFSGASTNAVFDSLTGKYLGTQIHN